MGDSLPTRYSLVTGAQHAAGVTGYESHAASAAAAAAAQAALSALRGSQSVTGPVTRGSTPLTGPTTPLQKHHSVPHSRQQQPRHRPAPASNGATSSSMHRQRDDTALASINSPLSRSSSAWSMSSEDDDMQEEGAMASAHTRGGHGLSDATSQQGTAGPVMVVNGMAVDPRGRRFSEFLTSRLDDAPYFKGFLGRKNLLLIARDGQLAEPRSALLDKVPDVAGDYLWLLRPPGVEADIPVFLGKAGGNNNGTLRRRFDEYLNANGTFGPLTDPQRFWPLQDALSRGFAISVRFLKGLKRGRPTAKLALANYNFPLNPDTADEQPSSSSKQPCIPPSRPIMLPDGRSLDDFPVRYPRLHAYSQSFRYQLAFNNNQPEETGTETAGQRLEWSWPAAAGVSGPQTGASQQAAGRGPRCEEGSDEEGPDPAAWFGLIAVLVNTVGAGPASPVSTPPDWEVKHKNPLFLEESDGVSDHLDHVMGLGLGSGL